MPIVFDNDFPKRLLEARSKASLTQLQLAAEANISRRRLAGYEGGETSPRLDTLYSLSKALGVHPEWLANGKSPGKDELSDSFDTLTARFVPIIAWEEAGKNSHGRSLRKESPYYMPMPMAVSHKAFAVYSMSDAMLPDYPKLSLLIVDPEVEPAPGCDVLVNNLVELNIPSFRRLTGSPGDGIFYKALNPDFPDKLVKHEIIHSIIGVVVASVKLNYSPGLNSALGLEEWEDKEDLKPSKSDLADD